MKLTDEIEDKIFNILLEAYGSSKPEHHPRIISYKISSLILSELGKVADEELVLMIAKTIMAEIDETPENLTEEDWQNSLRIADQILSLITPFYEAKVAEAVKAERKRIIKWAEERCVEHQLGSMSSERKYCYLCWQAL